MDWARVFSNNMRKSEARRLHDGDEVLVRWDRAWVPATVIGSSWEIEGVVFVNLVTEEGSYLQDVPSTDIR